MTFESESRPSADRFDRKHSERRSSQNNQALNLIHINHDFINEIRDVLDEGDTESLARLVYPLHAADVADLIEALSPDERETFLTSLKTSLEPQVLVLLEETVREQAIQILGISELARLLRDLDSDDALGIIESLDPLQQRAILKEIPAPERASLEQVLALPEDSAGRLMQREMVVIPPFWTVQQTLRFLRQADDLPEDFYEIYVVDPRYHLLGAVTLNHLIRCDDKARVSDILEERIQPILVTEGQKRVAYVFQHYGLVSAPVVDDRGRLMGMITADDVVTVIEEETERDILRLAGVESTEVHSPLFSTFYRRAGWLAIGLVNALITSSVISQFEASVAELTRLATLMPIAAAMGGNAGMQAVAVMVRAISSHEIRNENKWRSIIKEILVGCLNGLFFGLLVLLAVVFVYNEAHIGIILGSAMLFNMVWAGMAGALLPVMIHRLGFDPAIASGPILVATTDVLGYVVFLGLATHLLL